MRRTVHIAVIGFVLAVTATSARSQESPVNQVLGIEARDLADGTEITIQGSASPTFSVYRLDRPARIFVDFSNSELVGEVTNWAVRNGLVDEVLVLQYRDDVSLVTRVVVALDREDAEYDIETTDTDVIVTVTADGWTSPQAVAQTDAAEVAEPADEVSAQRIEELEARLAELQSRADTSDNQLETRSAELGSLESEVGRIAEREAAERVRADQLTTELQDVNDDLNEARSSESDARESMRQLAERSQSLEQQIQALTETVGQRDAVTEEVQEALSQRESLETELRQILAQQEEVEDAVAEAAQRRERFEQQATEAQGELESARDELERLRGERGVAEGQVAQARAELEQTEAQVAVRRGERDQLEAQLAEQRLEQQALQAELAAAELERQSMASDLAEAASERERINDELAEAVANRDHLQAELRQAAERRQSVETDLAEASEQLQTAVDQREQMDGELAAARSERDRISAQLTEAQAERERLDAEVAEATTEREQLQAELDEAAARRERIQTELDEAVQQRDALYAELDSAAEERERLNGELASLEANHDQEQAAVSQLSDRRAAIEAELARLHDERSEASSALDDVEARQQAATDQLARLQTERSALAEEIETAASQREAESSELAELTQARGEAETALQSIAEERERLATEVADMEARLASLRDAADATPSPAAAPADTAQDDEATRAEREALAAERERRQALETELARQREALARAQEQLAAREPSPAATVLASNESPDGRRDAVPAADELPARRPVAEAEGAEVGVVDVRFSQLLGVDRIEVEFDGPAPPVESLPWRDGRAGLVIPGARLPESLHRTLDTRAFGGPVQFVSTYTDEAGEVRLVAELSQAASEILSREGNVASWEFSSVETELAEAPTGAQEDFEGYNSQEEPSTAPPIRRPEGLTYTIGRQENQIHTPRLSRRFRVTIDVVNADIQNVLRLFSDQGDVNIIASGNVTGNITLRLRDVPLDLAFSLILQSQGLGFEQRGNIIRVAPLTEFEAEHQRELQRIAEAFDVEPLQVRLRPVSYADGDELIGLLADVLSSRGTASFDDRTHTLILTDVADNLDAAEQLIDALDTQTPQVLIEARIVQTSETFSQGFGIQWGGDALFSAANGNPTGLLFPSTIGIAGGAGQTPADGTAGTPNYAVNLPGPGNGAIGFQFGSLGQAINLNLRLSAAESSGNAKVISAPRVLTLDGQSATISTGVSIPVQTVGAAGTNVTFIQANLSLSVTPVVTPDGFVRLQLNVTKNEPDFARTGANGDPTIQTRTANTNLLVRDGETSVIGGIFEHIQGTDQQAVPFFADIPILGALFHNYSYQDERTETLIFITPRIVNRDVALTNYTPGGVLMTPPSD